MDISSTSCWTPVQENYQTVRRFLLAHNLLHSVHSGPRMLHMYLQLLIDPQWYIAAIRNSCTAMWTSRKSTTCVHSTLPHSLTGWSFSLPFSMQLPYSWSLLMGRRLGVVTMKLCKCTGWHECWSITQWSNCLQSVKRCTLAINISIWFEHSWCASSILQRYIGTLAGILEQRF